MFSVIFPGQGSQYIGMGLEIYKNHQYVKELFNLADDVLGYKLSKIIFEMLFNNLPFEHCSGYTFGFILNG